MRKIKYISLLVALFTVWSCQDIVYPWEEGKDSGYGSVVLTLRSKDELLLKTKAQSQALSPADSALYGFKFSSVLVILVDNTGKVAGNAYKDNLSTSKDYVEFENILPGNYTAYAYANIGRTQWQDTTILNAEYPLVSGNDFNLNRRLKQLVDLETPVTPVDSMLLTGKKAITVGVQALTDTIELKRPVVRFKVIIQNNTPYDVRVDNVSFTHFSPDRAFLIEHTDANGIPIVPPGTTYRKLPAYDVNNPVTIEDGHVDTVYSRYLYENSSPNPYKIFADLTLLRHQDNNAETDLSLSFGGREFGYIDYDTLNAMDEGEEVDVLLINPQISPRSGRIFCFISEDNRMAWESAGYNNEKVINETNNFYSRAVSIYQKDDSYVYTPFTGDNPGNTYGYSAWYGTGATLESPTFDYSQGNTIGSKYFHTLTKSGGLYSIEGLGVSTNSKGQITGLLSNMRIQKGAVVADKNPADMGDKLVRFINDSNGYFLQANTNYDKNEPRQQYTNLMWVSDNSGHQDRQFILYGKYSTGGALNRILSDSHREVPLTYMSRNEDISIIINVLYADTDGQLVFKVDNDNWVNATGRTSEHVFN